MESIVKITDPGKHAITLGSGIKKLIWMSFDLLCNDLETYSEVDRGLKACQAF
jgi:hypothetical protein